MREIRVRSAVVGKWWGTAHLCNARLALSKYSTSFSLWSTFLLIFPLSSYPDLALSYAVGGLVTRLRYVSLLTHSLSQLFMNTLCFVTIKAALFLFKTISAIKCCSRWELICFLSRLQLFPKNPALMGKLMWSSKLQSVTLIIFAPAVPTL